MSSRKPVPRRHCPQCAVPDTTGTPRPELEGKIRAATIGIDGERCGRPAAGFDKFERPVSNAKYWTNVSAHITGNHSSAVTTSEPPTEPEVPIAPASQDPSNDRGIPARNVIGQALTVDEIRGIMREELDKFSVEVRKRMNRVGSLLPRFRPL